MKSLSDIDFFLPNIRSLRVLGVKSRLLKLRRPSASSNPPLPPQVARLDHRLDEPKRRYPTATMTLIPTSLRWDHRQKWQSVPCCLSFLIEIGNFPQRSDSEDVEDSDSEDDVAPSRGRGRPPMGYQKGKSPAKTSSHPPLNEMIIDCIKALKDNPKWVKHRKHCAQLIDCNNLLFK